MLHGALKDDRLFGLVVGEAKRFIEERLVGENALAFDAAWITYARRRQWSIQ